MASSKVAISLPEQLLRLVDVECRSRGVSRSEFFRVAVEELFHRQEERKAVGSYVAGYERDPESEEEIREALAAAAAAVTEEPWE
jgi:metal-responsive CopG/Arc/MetJ family transcriptional regulator